MKLADRIGFDNFGLLYILIYPVLLALRLWQWVCDPHKFCKHNWISRKLEPTYGVFGGMEIYKCSKCGKEDWERNATKRLKRNGLL